MNRSRLLHLLGVAIGIAGLAFVAVRVVRDRDAIAAAFEHATPGWLVVAVVSGWAAMALIGVNWLWIMKSSDVTPAWRQGMSWFFVGQLGKYVPGGIWPIVGQAELAHRGSIPRSVAYSSTAWSMMATLLGAAVVGSVTGLAAADGERWISALIGAGVVGGFVALGVPAVRNRIDGAATRLGRRELRLPATSWLLTMTAAHVPVWVLFSGMNIFATAALGEPLGAELIVQLVAATCLSWMAGFVIIGLPGGLGVRETVFISLMSAPLGSATAVSVAVMSRLVSILVDVSAAAISVAVARSDRSGRADGRGESPTPESYAAP